ncbi:MAG TPA: ATP-binding protein [Puia sp.]|jgi:NadR type nicotinamide-nucleotide adenylyltransferase|nr:ATP-binding protein [Puia sp.]
MPLKKIVIIGPESTGKSTLCAELAAHFHTEWVREYAREYLEEHGMGYTVETLSVIARGQLALEDQGAGKANKLLFIDTDMYVMKVWSEYVFGRCEAWILDEIVRRKYDAYLLCNTDLPWAPDPLREYPDPGIRERLFHIYKDLLVNQPVPWAEVCGVAGERLAGAIGAVERLLG